MKQTTLLRSLFFFLLIMQISKNCSSQEAKEFFNSNEAKVTWLGIDFSEVRLLGDVGATPKEMKDRYFISINDVVINETEKYDFSKTFRKLNVVADINQVSKNNLKIDIEKLKTYENKDLSRFTPAIVESVVNKYDFGDKTGWGIVFIMEGLNKAEVEASMYVTIININKKKVVMTKRLTGKARGFGVRNYWAGAVFDVLQHIQKSQYDKWKSE